MKMRNTKRTVAVIATATLLTGCDGIFAIDNWEPPNALLTGDLQYSGQPVGVRVNGVNLQMWQIEPAYPLETPIPVRVEQGGRYSAAIFDGTYDINLTPGNGPWVDDATRRRVTVKGNTSFDIPVQPYYTIQSPTITYSPNPSPGGSITATFTVGQHNTTRLLEWVGVYIGTTSFVDRANGLTIANSIRERTRAAIQTNLNQNSAVTITVNLPGDIHLTPSPDRRNDVFVRVGVKTVGVAEMLFSPLQKVAI